MAVLQLLDWAWSKLTQPPSQEAFTHDPEHLAFVSKAALGLLKTYIREAYPEKGKIKKASLDCLELAESVYQARTLLRLILSSRGPLVSKMMRSPITLVLDACCDAFRACFHAFYPSVPLKWLALCQQLQYLDPVRTFLQVAPHCRKWHTLCIATDEGLRDQSVLHSLCVHSCAFILNQFHATSTARMSLCLCSSGLSLVRITMVTSDIMELVLFLPQHDVVTGVPMENLLSAILEALAEPTVSYIGLGYDTAISINAGV